MNKRWLTVLFALVMGFTALTYSPAVAQDATPEATNEVVCEPLPNGQGFTVLVLPKGETREAGTLIIEREVDHNEQTVDVRVTCLQGTTVIENDAWEGYPNVPYARIDACIEAQRLQMTAEKGGWTKGYTITLEGGTLPLPDPNDPKACLPEVGSGIEDDTRTQAELNEIVPAGTIIVEREVVFGEGRINVRAYEVTGEGRQAYWDTSYHLSIWYGYASLEEAQTDACTEAQALVEDAQVDRSWNEGFTVTFDGKSVEDMCF